MNSDDFMPDLTPTTLRFTDIDEFRSSVRNLEVDFTPLARRIAAEQTVLNLARCSINVTRSFPRIIDGNQGHSYTSRCQSGSATTKCVERRASRCDLGRPQQHGRRLPLQRGE